MKKSVLLLLSGVLCICACQKDPFPEIGGEKVDVSGFIFKANGLYVLNEGKLGMNNSTLDYLSFTDGNYKTGVFSKVNGGPLGDVGNDIAVHGDEIWMVINNSGIVEVVSAEDGKELAAIRIPTPRCIAFDDVYAYVTSWAGAHATYTYDENWQASLSDYSNPKGCVYRIDLKTKKIYGEPLEVGYQPEGIAYAREELYVANSGGISCQLPPNYSYDNTVSLIDTRSFKLIRNVEVAVNLKNVYITSDKRVYVTSFGNYYDVPSSLWMLGADVKHIGDYVSVSAVYGDTVYCYGTEQESDWTPGLVKTYKSWACKAGETISWSFSPSVSTPYSLLALDADTFFLGDAGDYMNPGSLSCYRKGDKLWTVTAGVCPGHLAVR